MEIKRYVVTQAVKTKENELIPIWDERIILEKHEDYGETIRLKGEWGDHHNLVECIYDLKTKKLNFGIELNYYPEKDKLNFKEGQVVLVEKSHKKLLEATISKIVFEDFDITIFRGNKLDRFWINIFKDIEIDPKALYAIKEWKPFYILSDGSKIEWEYQLYHKVD